MGSFYVTVFCIHNLRKLHVQICPATIGSVFDLGGRPRVWNLWSQFRLQFTLLLESTVLLELAETWVENTQLSMYRKLEIWENFFIVFYLKFMLSLRLSSQFLICFQWLFFLPKYKNNILTKPAVCQTVLVHNIINCLVGAEEITDFWFLFFFPRDDCSIHLNILWVQKSVPVDSRTSITDVKHARRHMGLMLAARSKN